MEDLAILSETYRDVGGVAEVPAELVSLLPRHKSDEARARSAVDSGFPHVAPILKHLLMWLQDGNWPVSHILADFLRGVGEPLADPIREILRSDDVVWKYWVLERVVKNGSPSLRQAIVADLRRIAETPSKDEVEEEVQPIALEIYRRGPG